MSIKRLSSQVVDLPSSITDNPSLGNALLNHQLEVSRSPENGRSDIITDNGSSRAAMRLLTVSESVSRKNKLECFEKIARRLRADIGKFVKVSAVRPNAIGFHVVPQPGLNISNLKISLIKAGDRLERLFQADSNHDSVSINIRTMASNLQTALDAFRVELLRQLQTDELGASESVLALRMMMQLRQNVTAALQEAAVFQNELRAESKL